jgi:hypothetical protein
MLLNLFCIDVFSLFFFRNSPMEWTKRHDTLLFREILVVNPFQAKKKTTQRALLWQAIAMNLKQLEDPISSRKHCGRGRCKTAAPSCAKSIKRERTTKKEHQV